MFRTKAAVLSGLIPLLLWGLPASGETVFTDQGGQEIVLSEPVQRAVTIPIPSASMFIAMDGDTSRLAGMHRLSKSAMKDLSRLSESAPRRYSGISPHGLGSSGNRQLQALQGKRPYPVHGGNHEEREPRGSRKSGNHGPGKRRPGGKVPPRWFPW